MEIKLPSTGSHRLDWSLMVALAIVLMVIFV
jgi:LPXTG-motif cell wall-anchored protein